MRRRNVYRKAPSQQWMRLVPVVCAVMLVVACGTSGGTDPIPEPDLVDQGWAAFEAGDFTGASTRFAEAIADDPTNNAAHNGLGWTHMKLDDLQGAVGSFESALTGGFPGAGPHAGKAIVLRDLEPVDYGAAIASVNAALGIDPNYVFAHDTALDWKDLRLILAQSHFALGEYAEANAQVGVLGGTVQDPASPRFVEDLLAEIERLGTIIAS
jgi:tetratricopeptide (TPR) repeat protein